RHAQVHRALDDRLVADDLGVHPRPLADRVDGRLHDERQVRQVDAVAGLEVGLQGLPVRDHRRHVDLDDRRQLRRRQDRLHHVLRDRAADGGELVDLLAGVHGGRGRRGGRGGSGRGGGRRGGRRRRCRRGGCGGGGRRRRRRRGLRSGRGGRGGGRGRGGATTLQEHL